MGSLGRSPSGLDLTIGVPGSSSSSSSSSPVWSGRLSFCSSLSSVAVDAASSTVFSSSFLDVLGPYIAAGGGGGSMRDLDINQPAYGGEEDYPMGSVEEEEEEGGTPRPKKLRLSKEQSRLLEESFTQHHTLNPKQKESLAMKLELRPRQVEVWFQNRRARTKLKHTEMECEFLKRCFGSLTQENRRLQREVEELRALRVAPPTVLSPHTRQPLPASSLTMCPRCERVTAAPHLAPSSAGRHPFRRPATLPFAGIADG